jgi:ABC-type uncharacterized transport system permease subunit
MRFDKLIQSNLIQLVALSLVFTCSEAFARGGHSNFGISVFSIIGFVVMGIASLVIGALIVPDANTTVKVIVGFLVFAIPLGIIMKIFGF